MSLSTTGDTADEDLDMIFLDMDALRLNSLFHCCGYGHSNYFYTFLVFSFGLKLHICTIRLMGFLFKVVSRFPLVHCALDLRLQRRSRDHRRSLHYSIPFLLSRNTLSFIRHVVLK